MSDEKEALGLDPESIKILQEMQKRLDAGEELDPLTQEAMKSIEFASQIVDSVMAGKQIDLAYLRLYTESITNKMNNLSNNKPKKPSVRKRRKRPQKD